VKRIRRGERLFYGWRIVAVAFVTHCINVGLVFYSFGVFLNSLTQHFGWSRAQVAFGFTLLNLFNAAYSPLIGRVVDRFGPRPSQLLGAVALGLGFFLLRGIETLTQYYVLMGVVVAFGSTALGHLPSNAAVANWFVRRRGRALGIATAGISMGGVIFVPLTQYLIEAYGWRNAFALLAGIVVLVSMPPVALFMRRSPESMGLRPDGDVPAGDSPHIDYDEELQRSWTPSQAIRHRNFWLIAAAFALTMMGIAVTLLHQISFLVDRGFEARHASWVLGAIALMGILGKLGFGTLLDRFGQRRVIIGCFALQAVGLICLAAPTSTATVILYVLLYGFAMGGNATLQATVLGDCFGRLYYGSIAGWMSPLVVLCQAAGVPLAGAVRDASGSYLPAFGVILVGNLIAIACVTRLDPHARPPRRIDGRPGNTTTGVRQGSEMETTT
jgi:MFS family permease